ncbi:uncharacterized protein [Typha latifolia]|uniref:uncharacterized protein isoform X2 n=1 Tax=Typha latifolia TaxID=4733 RepID=UPI003C304804
MDAVDAVDAEPSSSATAAASPGAERRRSGTAEDQIRVRRQTLEAVLEQCRRALEMIENADLDPGSEAGEEFGRKDSEEEEEEQFCSQTLADRETDELCELLKSKVESPNFLEKIGTMHASISQNYHDGFSSWNMISAADLGEDKDLEGGKEPDQDGYVLIREEDIVEGMASFMASYLLSLKQTKELTPNQLQQALSKTFAAKKKSMLRKAWDGSRVIYNLASWSATAVGIYQNPAILKAASLAFWSSCRVISKFL